MSILFTEKSGKESKDGKPTQIDYSKPEDGNESDCAAENDFSKYHVKMLNNNQLLLILIHKLMTNYRMMETKFKRMKTRFKTSEAKGRALSDKAHWHERADQRCRQSLNFIHTSILV